MFSRHKLLAALITASAVVGAFLVVAAPAEAAGGLVYASNTNDSSIAIYGPDATASNRPLGTSFVRVRCTSSKDCTGYASYKGITENKDGSGEKWGDPKVGTYYKVGHGQTAYIAVRLNTSGFGGVDQDVWTKPGWGSSVTGDQGVYGTLRLAQSGGDRTYKVVLTKRVPSVVVAGAVTGPSSADVKDLTIYQWSVSGLKTSRVASTTVQSDHTFQMAKKYYLGFNNVWSNGGRLSIQATVDGHTREWFWRGDTWGNGKFAGGSTDIREATQVSFNKDRQFEANFVYDNISGNVTGSGNVGADVDVAGAPYSMPTAKSDLRAMDYPFCANNFATTTTNGSGHYVAEFIPAADSGTDKRYAVHVTPAKGSTSADAWNDNFGSCLNVRAYVNSGANLIAMPVNGAASQDFTLAPARDTVTGSVTYSGVTPVTAGDKFVSLREVIPGRAILDAPIVATTSVNSSRKYTFSHVKPGKYWIELGRQTGCSWWYPSVYTNNDAYFEGLDRGDEFWKSFIDLNKLWSRSHKINGNIAWETAIAKGAYVGTKYKGAYNGSPKAGWMYRDYCKTNVSGYYSTVWPSSLPGSHTTTKNLSTKKGGVLKGHVSRGSKSNKEMLVEVHSTNGTYVRRTAYTDTSGNFRIYGIQPGTYTVEVNSDSWRGIGRTFSGTHTKTIGTSTSTAYSVGTLSAKF